jgi:hypothetical protein
VNVTFADWRASAAGVAESAVTAFRISKLIETFDRYEHHVFDTLHNELSDALTALHLEWLHRISVDQQHLQFTPIPTVDETGRIETRHTVIQC